ncbi:ribonuclease HIII [Bacillus thermotolerans]|uniref:ribonuclease HIII n=1 Tax=Bacillus thermotolerans TaxID=1221996 RepID=UPI00057F7209|nr:ribonuclease HIII [Bacillus thermotolerans]KKB34815.1 Ribonuclease HIII [Bacillus thermotolerans]
MSHTVLKVNSSTLSEMIRHYAPHAKDKLPPGTAFTAKTPTCAITGYRSGKVLFQGKGAEQEAAKWEGTAAKSSPSLKKPPSSVALPPHFSQMSVIGSDEVGTGDFFGPITVVSAYVRKSHLQELQALGVRDSKNLTDVQIASIAKRISKIIPYSLLILRNEKYNTLQQKGMSQGKIKALLHNQALLNLHKKISPEKPEAVLIDQFAEKNTYYRYLKDEASVFNENVFFSTKGESVHLSVAAASIIARYAFVKEMEALSREAGFILPKGAGSQVDAAAARLIREKGEAVLPHFTKVHFANTEKAKKLAYKH